MIKYSKVIYEPQSEPVSVDEVKVPLRITDDSEDIYLATLVKTARRMAERYSGLSFVTQTRQMKLDSFPCNTTEVIELPYGPVIAISGNDSASSPNTLGVSYVDDDGATQSLTLDTTFRLDSSSDIPRIQPIDDWPTDVDDERINAVSITYTAGYGSASDVPPEAKQAIICQVVSMYEDPEGKNEGLCKAAIALLDNIKVYFHAWQD
jgi:uncharacterized phiE125 gp8 family phage protein